MSTILHISDTHFGTEQPPVVDALRRLALARRPDVLVFSGDITQRAHAGQFAAARAFADSLGIPRRLVLPGNHDIALLNLAERIAWPYAAFKKAFGPDLEAVVDTADLLVVGVNTTRPSRHKNGVVSDAQIERVARRLRQATPGQLRVVVTHQPAQVSRAKDEHDRLRNADAALQAWSAAGADLVLGGHIHLPYVIDLTTGAQPTPRPMWCVQAGTAVSSRVRHGTSNSVNIIHWEGGAASRACGVERCDYEEAAGQFVAHEKRMLALG